MCNTQKFFVIEPTQLEWRTSEYQKQVVIFEKNANLYNKRGQNLKTAQNICSFSELFKLSKICV